MSVVAELKKKEDYYFDPSTPLAPKAPNPLEEKQPEIVTFPKKKAQRISRLEKVIVGFLVLGIIVLAFSTIYMRNEITKVQENTIAVQQNIQQKQKNIDQLQQEKTELSAAERIKAVAEKLGLTLHEDNIRNVK